MAEDVTTIKAAPQRSGSRRGSTKGPDVSKAQISQTLPSRYMPDAGWRRQSQGRLWLKWTGIFSSCAFYLSLQTKVTAYQKHQQEQPEDSIQPLDPPAKFKLDSVYK